MKDELNNYGIRNTDGSSGEQYGEGKVSFNNDNPRFVKEDALAGQPETPTFNETYDDRKKGSSGRSSSNRQEQSESGSSENLSSSSSASSASSTASSASSAASGAASSVASATSAIGSSIGALAGTVAAAATAAVVVVATFVSTLVINLLLVMAGMNSLVFQVEMRGAQEEDFQTPIIAILEGNGVHQEQEIYPDTVYLTFTGLEPGKEYTVWVKNEEKTFVKKSYITATEEPQQGSVEARVQENEVIATVDQINLKAGQFYTLTVKNAQGKTVFAKDDVEPSKEFRFAAPEAAGVYSVTVSIGGKACALSQFEIFDKSKPQPAPEPQYDFANGTWTWASDYLSASISFAEIHGGEPLVIEATISESYIEPTCETDGKTIYVATAVYNNRTYSDERTVAQPAGHSYQWVAESVDCIDEGMAGHYYCEVCGKYFDEDYHQVNAEDLILPAVGVAGDPVKLTSNDLSADLVGRQVYLKTDGSNGSYGVKIGVANNTTTDMNDLTAFTIESIDGSDVVLIYDGKYLSVSNNATVNFNSTSPNALTVSSYDGSISANSSYFICYDNWEEVIRMSNTAMNGYVYMYLIPTVDHSYGELIPANYEDNGLMAHYECSICHKLFDEERVETTAEALALGSQGDEPIINTGINVARITADMLLDNDDRPTVNLFEGFQSVTWEEISSWEPAVNDDFYVIYDYDKDGFYLCHFQNGQCVSDSSMYDTGTTNVELRGFIANGESFYYTSNSENAGQLGDVGLNVARITANMLLDNNDRPTLDLLEGFESVTWEEISSWEPTVNDEFYVIYDYVGNVFSLCHFKNGQCISSAPDYDETTTNAELRYMIANNGIHFFYTLGSESGGGSGNQGSEPVIDAGINAARITADMVSNNPESRPTADLFPGFQAITWEEIITWTPSVNDLLYVIYDFDANGFYVCGFENGQWDNASAIYDTTTTNEYLFSIVSDGGLFYYTLGSESGGGSGNQGTEPSENQGSGESPKINLNEGQLYINASGYARSESGLNNPTPFVSSAVNPYLIENQEIYGCDNIINVFQNDESIGTADIYIKLSSVTIEADEWCSLFRIYSKKTVNIYLIIDGKVSFTVEGQKVFSSQGDGNATVNIIIEKAANATFEANYSGENSALYEAQSGTINIVGYP